MNGHYCRMLIARNSCEFSDISTKINKNFVTIVNCTSVVSKNLPDLFSVRFTPPMLFQPSFTPSAVINVFDIFTHLIGCFPSGHMAIHESLRIHKEFQKLTL